MKKIIIITVVVAMALVFCAGCNKSDAKLQDQYESELIALGFENPDPYEYASEDYKIVYYAVELDSYIFDVVRGVDGVWFFHPLITDEMDSLELPRENGLKFVGWVGSAHTPTFQMYTANKSAVYFDHWPVAKADKVGGAYYNFYKHEDGTYNLTVEMEWKDPYWIPNISVKTLQEMALEYFKDDPHGSNSDITGMSDMLSIVWDFEAGTLKVFE